MYYIKSTFILKTIQLKYNDGLYFQILFKIVFKYNSEEDIVQTFL